MGIITDNASNNITFINSLSNWMKENDIFFDESYHFRCFAHVINISVQNALNSLKDDLSLVSVFESNLMNKINNY